MIAPVEAAQDVGDDEGRDTRPSTEPGRPSHSRVPPRAQQAENQQNRATWAAIRSSRPRYGTSVRRIDPRRNSGIEHVDPIVHDHRQQAHREKDDGPGEKEPEDRRSAGRTEDRERSAGRKRRTRPAGRRRGTICPHSRPYRGAAGPGCRPGRCRRCIPPNTRRHRPRRPVGPGKTSSRGTAERPICCRTVRNSGMPTMIARLSGPPWLRGYSRMSIGQGSCRVPVYSGGGLNLSFASTSVVAQCAPVHPPRSGRRQIEQPSIEGVRSRGGTLALALLQGTSAGGVSRGRRGGEQVLRDRRRAEDRRRRDGDPALASGALTRSAGLPVRHRELLSTMWTLKVNHRSQFSRSLYR